MSQEKKENIVKGTVRTEKATVTKKDAASSFGKDLLTNVIVPILKRGASTTLKTAVEWLFGDGDRTAISSTTRVNRSSVVSFIDYGRESERARRANAGRSRRSMRIDDFIFSNKDDAQKVLNELTNIIDQYGFASINDLYDICNKSCPYTGEEYGWFTPSNFSLHYDTGYDGYVLDLPNARPRR